MKLFWFLICLIGLSACAKPAKVVETPVPAAVPLEEAVPNVVAEKPKPAEPRFRTSNLIGLEKTTINEILGIPSLKRVEKQVEVWLYDNQFCNAHIYFYENDNSNMHVEYVETSEEKNLADLTGQRADFCISTFLQE